MSENGMQNLTQAPGKIEWDGNQPRFVPETPHQQILKAIAALADGLRSRDIQLYSIGQAVGKLDQQLSAIGSLVSTLIERQQQQAEQLAYISGSLQAIGASVRNVESMLAEQGEVQAATSRILRQMAMVQAEQQANARRGKSQRKKSSRLKHGI